MFDGDTKNSTQCDQSSVGAVCSHLREKSATLNIGNANGHPPRTHECTYGESLIKREFSFSITMLFPVHLQQQSAQNLQPFS